MILCKGERASHFDHEKIRLLRERRKLTMTEASLRAGWGRWGLPRWSLIERGVRKAITRRTLEQMALALGCRPDDLLTQNGQETPEKPGRKNFQKS